MRLRRGRREFRRRVFCSTLVVALVIFFALCCCCCFLTFCRMSPRAPFRVEWERTSVSSRSHVDASKRRRRGVWRLHFFFCVCLFLLHRSRPRAGRKKKKSSCRRRRGGGQQSNLDTRHLAQSTMRRGIRRRDRLDANPFSVLVEARVGTTQTTLTRRRRVLLLLLLLLLCRFLQWHPLPPRSGNTEGQ